MTNNNIEMVNCSRNMCERAWPDLERFEEERMSHEADDSQHIRVYHPDEGRKLHGVMLLTADGPRVINQRRHGLSTAISMADGTSANLKKHKGEPSLFYLGNYPLAK